MESAGLSSALISVTYGVDGGTNRYTVDVVSMLSSAYQVPALAHLTCVSSTESQVHRVLEELKKRNLENALALREDILKDGVVETGYRHTP